MKLRKTLAAAGALAIVGGMLAVNPASADTTTVTFTIDNTGLLSIDAPDNAPAALTVANTLTGGRTAAGEVGDTTVTDMRNSFAGWAVAASSSDFESPGVDTVAGNSDDGVVGCENVEISLDAIDTVTGLELLAGGQSTNVPLPTTNTPGCDPEDIATLTGLSSTLGLLTANNTATFSPSIDVTIPAGTVAGVYTATVTQTVS